MMKTYNRSRPKASYLRGNMIEQAVGNLWPDTSRLEHLASDIRSLVNSGIVRHDEIAGPYVPFDDRIEELRRQAGMPTGTAIRRRLDTLFGLMIADEPFWRIDHADMLKRLAEADDMMLVRASKLSEEQEEWNRKLSKQMTGTYQLSSAPGSYHKVAVELAQLDRDDRHVRLSNFANELAAFKIW